MQRADIIDLSSNNPQIDFQAVAKIGVKAVLHKASEGVGYIDNKCLPRLAQAKSAGMKIGAYHYLRIRHGKPQDAHQQAQQYLVLYRAANCDMLPCVDVETAFNTNYGSGPLAGKPMPPEERCTNAEIAQAVSDFIDAIRVAGYNCIIYTSHGEWVSMGLSVLSQLASCPLWVAAYGSSASAPPPWKTFAAWQWTGLGAMNGVVGPVDISQCDDLNLLLKSNPLKIVVGVVAALLATAAAYYHWTK